MIPDDNPVEFSLELNELDVPEDALAGVDE